VPQVALISACLAGFIAGFTCNTEKTSYQSLEEWGYCHGETKFINWRVSLLSWEDQVHPLRVVHMALEFQVHPLKGTAYNTRETKFIYWRVMHITLVRPHINSSKSEAIALGFLIWSEWGVFVTTSKFVILGYSFFILFF